MLTQILRGQDVYVPTTNLPMALESTAQIVAAVAPVLSVFSMVALLAAVPVTLFLFLLKDARWKLVLSGGIGFFLVARMLPFLFAWQLTRTLAG